MAIKPDVLEAINYYTEVTGESVSQFLEGIDSLLTVNEEELTNNDWLRKQIAKLIKNKGVSLDEIIKNKDLLMAKDTKEEDGSFYTPLEWAAETHRMIEKYIPNLEDYVVWDASCGSGNLLAELPPCKELYVSTLHQEDAEIVQKRLPHAHAFQLDFLTGIDYNEWVTEFTDGLPEGLQRALRNNEPILFLMNPPYSITNAHKTQVAKHLKAIGKEELASDLLRQFVWRVYNLVDIHGLSNSYFTLIGTNSLYIMNSWESTVREMQEHADYLEGFTFPASEFAGIEKSVQWGIFSTIWKTTELRTVETLPSIQMTAKKKDENGVIYDDGVLDFVWDKQYMPNWIQSKITKGNRITVPVTSVRGVPKVDANGEVSTVTGLDNALGYFLVKSTFKDIANFNGIGTLPITLGTVPVTEENFKDVCGCFAFLSTYKNDFNDLARPFNEPHTGSDEYREWIANSILFSICARKGYMFSVRNIEFNREINSVNSTIFPFSHEQVREYCQDEKVLKDLEENPVDNSYFLNLVEESKPYAWKGVMNLYNAVTNFIKQSYNYRHTMDYEGSTVAWNAGFHQLKQTAIWTDEMEEAYVQALSIARDEFRERVKTHYIV
ncbi:hypothetical protein P4493_05325 [Bacillus thuringiensis]|uniref:N-6 DNA Methylase family protein n=3 Tax=Bacillus thuringiensis TaxID=1428 RepID=A0A0B5NKJ5_BACTU|nr:MULTISPECIES: hypothetical protein [Bacillus]EAO56186.1 Hypothetical protein RBTH_07510 [Bacillus thuringiensis serovar israelensis ATCC 35646]MEC2536175.1 hypothetical protein [Bacillus cereus]MED1153583.1 hypothetical protein [Bacillus paranthracis]OUB09130.1 hypothetical protein BK708_31815 [Bacillus thuringiensis serovar yunnanensis]AFQ29910.1 hypothetical protein BTF1_29047 [Bacillus thuringiensis HD-789]